MYHLRILFCRTQLNTCRYRSCKTNEKSRATYILHSKTHTQALKHSLTPTTKHQFELHTMNSSATPSAGTSDSTRRVHMTYHELNKGSVTIASTLTLLRERASDLSAVLARMNRCTTASPVQEFTFDTGEGEGDTCVRVARLTEYVRKIATEVGVARARINSDYHTKRLWKISNKGGGVLKKRMRELSQYVVNELFRREIRRTLDDCCNLVNETMQHQNGGKAVEQVSAAAPSSPTNNMKVAAARSQQDEGDARREREMAMEDAGIAKPSRGEKLIARRVQTYKEGNVEFALQVKQTTEKQ